MLQFNPDATIDPKRPVDSSHWICLMSSVGGSDDRQSLVTASPSTQIRLSARHMPAVSRWSRRLAGAGKKVFIDLKLHDIGNTVSRGVESIAKLGATFLTVHAYPQTMKAAVEARAGSSLKILAVTVLTSYDDGDLHAGGLPPRRVRVGRRPARGRQRQLGIDGLVCAPEEAVFVAQYRRSTGCIW